MIREAYRSCVSRPFTSVMVIVIVLVVTGASLASVGQAVATENRIRSLTDDASLRTIVVSDLARTGAIPSDAVARLAGLDGVAWVVGLGPAVDVRNAQFPSGVGRPVALRPTVAVGVPELTDRLVESGGLATSAALERLSMTSSAGGVTTAANRDVSIVGEVTMPAGVPLFAELVLVPESALGGDGLVDVVVRAATSAEVSRLSRAVPRLLGTADSTDLGISTSEDLASFQLAAQGEARRNGRVTLLATLGLGLALVAVVLLAAVSARRREFGRRRALGASRWAVGALVVLEAGMLAGLGALVGSAGGFYLVNRLTGADSDLRFTLAVGFLTCFVGLIAALPPAIAAGKQDPVRIVRVP